MRSAPHPRDVLFHTLVGTAGSSFALLLCFAGLWEFVGEDVEPFLNQAAPISLTLVCLGFAGYAVRCHPPLIWTPVPWFLAAGAAYYGLGPLVYPFGNEITVAISDCFFPVDESTLAKTQILNLLGIGSVAAGGAVGVMLWMPRAEDSENPPRPVGPDLLRRVAFVFLIVGVIVKYGIVLPYEFGMLQIVLPGVVNGMQYFSSFAMAVLMLAVHRGDRGLRPLLLVLVGLEFVTSILVFSKMSVMVFFIMLLLGRVLVVHRLRPILVGSMLVALSFALTAPLVAHGRAMLIERTGTHYQAGLATRLEIVQGFFAEDVDRARYAPSQLGWARLNYANAQAFAMGEYDAGRPGDSFVLAVAAVVPRFLWPDKPVMTIGRDFNYLVNGNDLSSSAPGLFGEAYWNGGWLAVIVASLFVGVLLALFARYTVVRIRRHEVLYLPIVFAGIKLGFRPDDWFAATYVGAPVTAVVLHFVLRGGESLLRSWGNSVRGPATEAPLG